MLAKLSCSGVNVQPPMLALAQACCDSHCESVGTIYLLIFNCLSASQFSIQIVGLAVAASPRLLGYLERAIYRRKGEL